MPTPTRAKPPVSAWIIRERKRLGLKPRDLAERLTASGLQVTEGTVRTWEAGRNPHPDNIEGLERIFGTRSPESGEAGDTPAGLSELLPRIDGLLAVMGDQAKLVTRLLDENQAIRQELERVARLTDAVTVQVTRNGERIATLEQRLGEPIPKAERARGSRGPSEAMA